MKNTKKYYWIGALLLLLVIGGLVTATTLISDNSITTPEINNVLYVEAGNADDIQVKINSCPDDGCTIIIPSGTYYLGNTILINNNTNFMCYNSIINSSLIYMINNSDKSTGNSNIKINGCKFVASNETTVIDFRRVDNVIIEYNIIEGGLDGIFGAIFDASIIQYNHISGTAQDGIDIQNVNTNSLDIISNYFNNTGSDCIELSQIKESVITNNRLENCNRHGMFLKTLRDVVIDSNVIKYTGRNPNEFSFDGIVLTNKSGQPNSAYVVISNNVILDNNADSLMRNGIDLIQAEHSIISSNNIREVNNSGIKLEDTTAITVIGNHMQNNNYGLLLNGSSYTTISGNDFAGNNLNNFINYSDSNTIWLGNRGYNEINQIKKINYDVTSSVSLVEDNATIVNSYTKLDTQGLGATDNLKCIYGTNEGDNIYLKTTADSRDIVFVHANCPVTTNRLIMRNATNYLMSSSTDVVHCINIGNGLICDPLRWG